jgi:DnaK suppressor protein
MERQGLRPSLVRRPSDTCDPTPSGHVFVGNQPLMSGAQLDLQHFRSKLHALRRELSETAATSKAAAAVVELDQSRIGRLSRMDAMQGQAMSAQLEQRREQHLADVERALDRLEQGDFGLCASCGEPIAAARLDFEPTITICIGCASAQEDT